MRAVPSAEAVARREPSGLKATQMTVSVMHKGSEAGCSGQCVPDAGGAVEAAGREQAAIAAKSHAEDPALVRSWPA